MVLPGAILTKMDGDSRGGAALSVKAISGKPIKFVGTGEKLEALEPFYPDRTASRILGRPPLAPAIALSSPSLLTLSLIPFRLTDTALKALLPCRKPHQNASLSSSCYASGTLSA